MKMKTNVYVAVVVACITDSTMAKLHALATVDVRRVEKSRPQELVGEKPYPGMIVCSFNW